jgi:MFS family permease
MSWMTRDGRLILAAKTCRTFGYGLLSVVLGLYLDQAGFAPAAVGGILSASLAGSALLTALLVARADRLGRRRVLAACTVLMMASGLAFAVAHEPWLLVLAALTGTISATSGEVGPFETVEHAILPQTTAVAHRNRLFGWYNTLAALAVAGGALAAGLPLPEALGYRAFFAAYAGAALLSLLCLLPLSAGVELAAHPSTPVPAAGQGGGLQRSRRVVAGLSALFALDALGGGFVVQSLLAYWFALKFGANAALLGPLFFGVNLLKAVSYPLAVRLAGRIGLINTMVFTHLPSNLLLILLPLLPSLPLAVACLLLRHLLSQMDVPARGSYVMAVVDPAERTAAAGLTTLARTAAHTVGPALAGLALQAASTGAPFLIGGALKIVYDLALYASFRSLKPADEIAREALT